MSPHDHTPVLGLDHHLPYEEHRFSGSPSSSLLKIHFGLGNHFRSS